jgi:hypothetical protein
MAFVLRHPASILIVLAALLATTAVFAFARPEYHRQYESKMIDFSKQHYYSAATVRRAFAQHGVRLRYSTLVFSKISWLSNTPPPFPTDALSVFVGPRTGTGSWGPPKLEPYDERFGNILVTYGGNDDGLVKRVHAAVSELR